MCDQRKNTAAFATYLTKDLIEKMAFEHRLEGGERFRQWLSEHAAQKINQWQQQEKGECD